MSIAVIKEATDDLLDSKLSVASCKQVQKKVLNDYQMTVGSKLVGSVLKKEMRLVYK